MKTVARPNRLVAAACVLLALMLLAWTAGCKGGKGPGWRDGGGRPMTASLEIKVSVRQIDPPGTPPPIYLIAGHVEDDPIHDYQYLYRPGVNPPAMGGEQVEIHQTDTVIEVQSGWAYFIGYQPYARTRRFSAHGYGTAMVIQIDESDINNIVHRVYLLPAPPGRPVGAIGVTSRLWRDASGNYVTDDIEPPGSTAGWRGTFILVDREGRLSEPTPIEEGSAEDTLIQEVLAYAAAAGLTVPQYPSP